jgi:hypothetical protein
MRAMRPSCLRFSIRLVRAPEILYRRQGKSPAIQARINLEIPESLHLVRGQVCRYELKQKEVTGSFC